MSPALYREWRPKSWEEIVGQRHVTDTLHNALKAGRFAHAYLFSGPRGTGKTTTARLVAKTVNCMDEEKAERPCNKCPNCVSINKGKFLDLIEIDAASNTSVEDVRELRDKINFSPNVGPYKVYIIDEVHMLSTAAFNALLKTLEEPPTHALFVLATTEPHKIPATVLSRCQRHEFRRIPITEINAQLEVIVEKEGFQAQPKALELIARQATGSMRDAISLLDQLASSGDEINLQRAQDVLGTATNLAVIELIDSLVEKDTSKGLEVINRVLDSGSDARQFARQVVDYLRSLLQLVVDKNAQIDELEEVKTALSRHSKQFGDDQHELMRIMRLFNQAAVERRSTWQPSLPLEMAFIESLETSTPKLDAASQGSTLDPALSQPELKAPGSAESPRSKPIREDLKPRVDLGPQDQKSTQDLNNAWGDILELVRSSNSKTYGLLNSSKMRYIKGDHVVICFASEVLKSKMEKEGNIESVQAALKKVFNRQMAVRCEVDSAQINSIPPDLDQDGIVATALRDLGGEIVDVQ